MGIVRNNRFLPLVACGLLLLFCNCGGSLSGSPSKKDKAETSILSASKAGLPDEIYQYIVQMPLSVPQKNKLMVAVKDALIETKDPKKRDKALEDAVLEVGDISLAKALKNKVNKVRPILSSSSASPMPAPKIPPSTKSGPSTGLGGLANLGNTCFANASIQMLLASGWVRNVLPVELLKQPTESEETFKRREELRKALLALYTAKENRKPQLCNELNAFFDAYKKARDANKGPLLEDEPEIGVDQGDAKPFIDDILRFFDAPEPILKYGVFVDGAIGIFPEREVIIPLPLDPTIKNKSMADLIYDWQVGENLTGKKQVRNKDSISYQRLKKPAPASLFISLGRFTSQPGDPEGRRLRNEIAQSKEVTFVATNENNINDSEKVTYTLRLIIIHDGDTGLGHYYAYSFEQAKNQWTLFNDSKVSTVSEGKVFEDAVINGYLYLYEKRI